MKHLLRIPFLFILLSAAQLAAAAPGQLIGFFHQANHPVTQDFIKNYWPQLEKMAAAQGIESKLVDVEAGAPDMFAFTPAIVFQNHLGRSLYVGRYHYVDKVKTFIRTVKRMPQVQAENMKEDVFVMQTGKGTVVNPVKITDLAGVQPKGFDPNTFRKQALAAIGAGMANFKYAATFAAARNNRLVYSAFYPYRSEDGKFFLSIELYSQFNCIEPIYKRFDPPFSGSWKGWQAVFSLAAKEVENQIAALLQSVDHGDGALPIPASVPLKSFDDLGLPLPLPEPGQKAAAQPTALEIPNNWVLDGPAESDLPMVGFAFPAPLDNYAGELTALTGFLNLGPALDMSKATGKFTVDMESLTMGDESLDHSVQGMLKVVDFKQSDFTFSRFLRIANPQLAFGTETQFVVEGEFVFMGIKAPVQVTAQVQPVLDESGQLRLQVNAAFDIHLLETYHVKGPDGPAEARDKVIFTLNFLLKPAA